MKSGKITISDIADTLGISAVSISRALSGQPGVGEELKHKIIKKAKEMGYTKTKKNSQVRILVLYQHPSHPLDSSNLTHKLQGIEKALQSVNAFYHMEFVDKTSVDKGVIPYNLTQGYGFDGVILIGKFSLEYANLIKEKINQLLFFTGYSPSYNSDCVWYNFSHAGYITCEYLIKKGHQRIGFVGNPKIFRNAERILGISAALEDYKLQMNPEFFGDLDENYLKNIRELIHTKSTPTALICDRDFTAFELIKLLYENDIKVPQDISIIGSGNTDMASLSIPALTTLDLNIEYSCAVAVTTLLKRISHPDKPYQYIGVLSNLVERDSVRRI